MEYIDNLNILVGSVTAWGDLVGKLDLIDLAVWRLINTIYIYTSISLMQGKRYGKAWWSWRWQSFLLMHFKICCHFLNHNILLCYNFSVEVYYVVDLVTNSPHPQLQKYWTVPLIKARCFAQIYNSIGYYWGLAISGFTLELKLWYFIFWSF